MSTHGGAQILKARIRAGLTQQQLAESSGVRQPNIAAYENGQRRPSAAMVERLIAAARVRPSSVLARHRQEVRATAVRNHASNVRVFGSVARGTDDADSDLDLLVSFDEDATLLDQAALIEDLEELLGVSVDVLSDHGLRVRDRSIWDESIPV